MVRLASYGVGGNRSTLVAKGRLIATSPASYPAALLLASNKTVLVFSLLLLKGSMDRMVKSLYRRLGRLDCALLPPPEARSAYRWWFALGLTANGTSVW